MCTVEDFILDYSGNQKRVLHFLHNLLMSEYRLIDKIRFKIPFYYRKSWICYMNPMKDGAIELAFTRGNELSNERGLLQSKGRKQVFGIEFRNTTEIPEKELKEILHEAIMLDETIPYASKRKNKKL